MAFDVDGFLQKLQNDKSQGGDFGDRAKKLLMNNRDNTGTCVFVPFSDGKHKGDFYTNIKGVREIKLVNSGRGTDPIWHKILPKEIYGNLSPEDSKLYDDVAGIWDQLYDTGVMDYNLMRWRTYLLFYGHVIVHKNEAGNDVQNSAGSAALLIYPSSKIMNGFIDAIGNTITAQNGNKEWLPAIFSDDPVNRQGAISISFKSEKGGSTFNIQFQLPTSYYSPVPAGLDMTADLEKFGDIVRDFNGWQNPEDPNSYFNPTIFSELRLSLAGLLEAAKKNPAPASAPEVQTQVQQPVTTPTAQPQPAPQPAPAPTVAAPTQPQQQTNVFDAAAQMGATGGQPVQQGQPVVPQTTPVTQRPF